MNNHARPVGEATGARRPSTMTRWRAVASLLVGLTLATLGCEPKDPCGNGVIDPGEACDDGNTVSGDGCSATCQLDDNLSTPGDDRAGFITCDGTFAGASVTCGPGLGCCNDPDGAVCAASLSDCVSPFDFQGCDGNEDCTTPGQHCWVYKITSCSDVGYDIRCHTDADCPTPGDICDRGSCPLFSAPASVTTASASANGSP